MIRVGREASPPRVDANGFTNVRGKRPAVGAASTRCNASDSLHLSILASPLHLLGTASTACPTSKWWRHARVRRIASIVVGSGTLLGTASGRAAPPVLPHRCSQPHLPARPLVVEGTPPPAWLGSSTLVFPVSREFHHALHRSFSWATDGGPHAGL